MFAALDAQGLGFLLCALGFLAAAGFGAWAGGQTGHRWAMAAASLVTAATALPAAVWPVEAPSYQPFLVVLRSLAWIAFLAATLRMGRSLRRLLVERREAVAGGLLAAASITALWLRQAPVWDQFPQQLQLLVSVLGLLLLETLFRNSQPDGRWGIKWICLGLGVLFVYDFYAAADSLLTHDRDPGVQAARGYVDLLAVPLLMTGMARAQSWQGGISLSRKMVLHSAVLVGSGAYLMIMSLAGTVLRSLGGGWGPVLQAVFLVAAALTMLVAVSSGSFRAAMRVQIAKHFFRHKYDYREVWLTFIQRISRDGDGNTLHARILHAVADIFDCPGAALWVPRQGEEGYFPTVIWNFGDRLPVEPADGSLARFLAASGWIVDLDQYRRAPDFYGDLALPDWLVEHARAWAVVPLAHKGRLEGFLVLGAPRARRVLGWEDLDLLKTVGAQAASYLAEESSSRAVADARRLDEFNRRFAFVVHDIKNVVSQMSLMVENARRHGSNPDFQRDMLLTVAESVERMRRMLEQLKTRQEREDSRAGVIDLAPVLKRLVEQWRASLPQLAAKGIGDGAGGRLMARADGEQLGRVIAHLLQNAVDATGPSGKVEIRLRQEPGEAVIEVSDDGPGMDGAFIRDKLFEPLASSKPGGFGLGAYQARELVRQMGGRLEVDSRPGAGTTMRLFLRREEAADGLPAAVESGVGA